MTDSGDTAVRFDDCELDLASRALKRAGELVPLEPRVFDLLVYLYEQRDRAVDKDEIQKEVWKGRIVSETALTRAIMKARRAVGDSADRQGVIRTVHGHGYQFVATPPAAGVDGASPAETPQGAEAVTPARGWWWPMAAAALLAVAVIAVLMWPVEDAPAVPVRVAVLPVDNAVGDADYEWTRLGLMGFANDLIRRAGEFSIVPAADVMRFVEVAGQPAERSSEDLGKLRIAYGASHMLASRLEANAGALRLTYALYAPGGRVRRGTMVGAEPTALVRGMIRSVAAELGERPYGADEITVISEDPFVNEAYSRGLSLSLEGRCGDALTHFEVVIAGQDTVSEADYDWANCARILGRWQEAEARFEKLLAETESEPPGRLRTLALNGLGTVYYRTGRIDEARDTYERGLSAAVAIGDAALQGKLLNSLAIAARSRREYDLARELLARAMVAHSDAGAEIMPGQLPAALANIDMAEGKFDDAEKHLDQALAAFRALGDRRNEAMMLNNYGYLRRLQDRPIEAEPLHLQSLAIRREIGDMVGQGRILGMLSTLYEADGRLQEARAAATEAYEIASAANDRLFMATSLAQLAAVEASDGQPGLARTTYRESMALFDEIGDHSRSAQVALRLARLDFMSGEFDTARRSASQVLSVSRRESLPEPAIEALELIGDIARAQGDAAGAIAAYREAIAAIDDGGFVSRRADITIKLAHKLLDEQDLTAVEPLIGFLIEQGNTSASLKLRARYAAANGDTRRARTLMESAQSMSEGDWTEQDTLALAGYREASAAERDR